MVFGGDVLAQWRAKAIPRQRRRGHLVLPIVTITILSVAAILTMICMFAGSNSKQLRNVSMLSIDAKDMGQINLNPLLPDKFKTKRSLDDAKESIQEKGDEVTEKAEDLGDKASDKVDEVKDKAEDFAEDTIKNAIEKVQKLLNDTAADIRREIGISEAYSLHMLNDCRGDADSNGTMTGAMNCTEPKMFFYFNPAQFLAGNDGNSSSKLSKLGWPDFMDTVTDTLAVFNRSMVVFYLIAIITLLICLPLVAIEMFAHLLETNSHFEPAKFVRYAKYVCALTAFTFLFLASILSSALIYLTYYLINAGGALINIHAKKGSTFLGLTWSATVLVGFACAIWFFQHRSRARSFGGSHKLQSPDLEMSQAQRSKKGDQFSDSRPLQTPSVGAPMHHG